MKNQIFGKVTFENGCINVGIRCAQIVVCVAFDGVSENSKIETLKNKVLPFGCMGLGAFSEIRNQSIFELLDFEKRHKKASILNFCPITAINTRVPKSCIFGECVKAGLKVRKKIRGFVGDGVAIRKPFFLRNRENCVIGNKHPKNTEKQRVSLVTNTPKTREKTLCHW